MAEDNKKIKGGMTPEQILLNIVNQLKGKFGYSDEKVSVYLDETKPLEERLEAIKLEQKAAKDAAKKTADPNAVTGSGATLSDSWPSIDEIGKDNLKLVSTDAVTGVKRYLYSSEDSAKGEGVYIETLPVKGNIPERINFNVNPHIPNLWGRDTSGKFVDYSKFHVDAERIVTLCKETGNPECIGDTSEKYDGQSYLIILFNGKLYSSGHTNKTQDTSGMNRVILSQLTPEIITKALRDIGFGVLGSFKNTPVVIMGEFYGPGVGKAGSKYISGKDSSPKWRIFDIRYGFHNGSTVQFRSEEDKVVTKLLKIGSGSENVYGWLPKSSVKKFQESLVEQGVKNVEFVRTFGKMTLNDVIEKVKTGFKSDSCYRDGVNLGPCDQAINAEGIIWEYFVKNVRVQIKVRADDFNQYNKAISNGETIDLHLA